jgi:hypothetical protein
MSLRLATAVLGLLALPALATSVVNGKVTRVRDNAGATKVFIEITPRPTLVCISDLIAPAETYVIDADTIDGRAVYAQLLAAFNTQTTVGILGTGTCETFGTLFFSRYERVARVVACNPANPPTCTAGVLP